eukprot:COSAG05_NODE_3061_length_2368_cov_6.177171_3_plen_82_part_01
MCNGDRPKLLFDKDGVTPIALTTAAGQHPWNPPLNGLDEDQSYRLCVYLVLACERLNCNSIRYVRRISQLILILTFIPVDRH